MIYCRFGDIYVKIIFSFYHFHKFRFARIRYITEQISISLLKVVVICEILKHGI